MLVEHGPSLECVCACRTIRHIKVYGARSIRGRTVRCAKSRLFSITGSHGSQGLDICTLQPLLVHLGFFYQYDACHGSQGPEFCTPGAVLN